MRRVTPRQRAERERARAVAERFERREHAPPAPVLAGLGLAQRADHVRVARHHDVRGSAARVGDRGDLLDARARRRARLVEAERRRFGAAAAELDEHRARALVGEVKDAARPAAREEL